MLTNVILIVTFSSFNQLNVMTVNVEAQPLFDRLKARDPFWADKGEKTKDVFWSPLNWGVLGGVGGCATKNDVYVVLGRLKFASSSLIPVLTT
jgi:hypothetical protein